MTRPHKAVSRAVAVLRGPWASVAAAQLPRDTRTLHVDGEVEALTGILDLPELSILELSRWTGSIEPLAEHASVTSLTIGDTGGFGPPVTLAYLPALEHLSIGVREDDAPRVPGLMDQIPWREIRRLHNFAVGVDGWDGGPLASHDLAFLSDLEHVRHASPVGTVTEGAAGSLASERIPTALRELRLIEREPDELAVAAARLEARGVSVSIIGQADVIPALPWPSPRPADSLGDLADEAVWLEDTDDGWELVVLGSALPADWSTSMFGDRLVERIKPGADVMIDVEGEQLTIMGTDRRQGRRFEAAADAIVREIWDT